MNVSYDVTSTNPAALVFVLFGIGFSNISFPTIEQKCSDPRVYEDAGRWRDTWRRQYSCKALSLQIHRLWLTERTETGSRKLVLHGIEQRIEWSEALKHFDAIEKSFLVLWLKLADEEAEIYESTLGPLQTDDLFNSMSQQ